jgi:SAM-dependent methyltransferase
MPVFIDTPEPDIAAPRIDVFGWVAAEGTAPLVRVTANGRRVRHILHDRPDVRRSLPDLGFVAGVYAPLNVFDLEPCDAVEIALTCGLDTTRRRGVLLPPVQQARAADATLRLAARDRCFANLTCPSCRSMVIRDQAGVPRMVCGDCGEVFSQSPRPINMIPDRLLSRVAVTEIDNIALAPASTAAGGLIRRVTGDGGWVLEIGAARRAPRTRHVVTVGSIDHGRVDLLAAPDALPFAEGSFDAAIALSVLDQIADPPACARELLRVVKPGGDLLVAVPAMRPAPTVGAQTYDLTRQGLAALFDDGGEVVAATAPAGGEAFQVVQALLRDWLAVLPDAARDSLAAMTIGAAATADPAALLGHKRDVRSALAAGLPDACLALVQVRRR